LAKIIMLKFFNH